MTTREFLGRLDNVERCGCGWTARCPAHDDDHNSLSVGEGDDGRVLLHCHAGCAAEQVCAAVGVELKDLMPDSPAGGGKRRLVKTYDYTDENGALLYQNCRFEHKGFSQRRPDGKGGFVWKLNGVRRVPYRLPDLLESELETVFLTEGEKDADNLSACGLLASNFKNWRPDFNRYISRFSTVVILQDHDGVGVKQAADAARVIFGSARELKVLDLFAGEPLPDKGGRDVSDWMEAGGAVDELLALAEQAPLWRPDAKAKQGPRFHFTPLDDLLAEPEEETAFVWDRTLPRGGFSICSSKPKVGKSTFVRNLAVAVPRGEEFFGRATARGKVIYLCLEEKRAEVARHFRRMGAGGTDIIIHTGPTPQDAIGALGAAVEEHSPALIIIDPLSRFVRITDFNSYGEATRALEPLIDLTRSSECRCHILAIHHDGKAERETGDALLGSTGFFGAVDALLTMKRRKGARTIETVQRYGEDMPETVVRLDPETGLVTPHGDMQTLLLDERKAAVLDNLDDEPLAEADIKERVSGNQGLTSKAVRALYEEGKLLRTGAGKKGDPYRYQKAAAPASDSGFPGSTPPEETTTVIPENPNKNSGYSGFPVSTDLENPENLESDRFLFEPPEASGEDVPDEAALHLHVAELIRGRAISADEAFDIKSKAHDPAFRREFFRAQVLASLRKMPGETAFYAAVGRARALGATEDEIDAALRGARAATSSC